MGKDNILQIKRETIKIEISHFHLIQTPRYHKPTPPNGARWCSLSYPWIYSATACKSWDYTRTISSFSLSKKKARFRKQRVHSLESVIPRKLGNVLLAQSALASELFQILFQMHLFHESSHLCPPVTLHPLPWCAQKRGQHRDKVVCWGLCCGSI